MENSSNETEKNVMSGSESGRKESKTKEDEKDERRSPIFRKRGSGGNELKKKQQNGNEGIVKLNIGGKKYVTTKVKNDLPDFDGILN